MRVVVEVRRSRADEAAVLRDVRLRALAESPGAFLSTVADAESLPDEEWRRRATEQSAGDTAATFLAEVAGRQVGMVCGFRREDGAVDLVAMWVDPAHRRAGVGAALVDAVVTWAAKAAPAPVDLDVAEANVGARRFYERLGFEAAGPPHPVDGHPGHVVRRMRRQPAARSGSVATADQNATASDS